MGIRSKAIDAGIFWAQPNPYTAKREDLIDIFRYSGCEQIPSKHDLDKTFTPTGNIKYGCYVAGQKKHWCGIFATMLLKGAGADIRWTLMSGRIIGDNVASYNSKPSIKDARPGDVACVTEGNHHFLVKSVEKDYITTIEGNVGYQKIKISTRTVINGLYSFIID